VRVSSYPLVDAEVAASIVLDRTAFLGRESVPLREALGRVTAEDVKAPASLPADPVSAVDGFAVRAVDAGKTLRVLGESAAGRPYSGRVEAGAAARILTGGVLPDGADCVVMFEDVQVQGDSVRVPSGLRPGSNFHAPGADVQQGELVIPAGTQLGAAEIGLAAALNLPQLQVGRRPAVALLSTGDELVEVGGTLGRGQITDSNRWALLAALREAGADVRLLGIAPDDPKKLRDLVTSALEHADVLVTSGGVSVGTHDLVKPLLESIGTVHVGRVKLKPGKPFTFATLDGPGIPLPLAGEGQGEGGKVAIGLPGFPVSSLVTFEVFVRPALRKMQGFSQLQRPTLRVRMGFDAQATAERTEYHRVTMKKEGSDLVAYSTGSQSSSRLMSLAGAHALVRVPPGDQGLRTGDYVEALILSLP
jgi:molybdenum cofactor synthesis domain-containing protein